MVKLLRFPRGSGEEGSDDLELFSFGEERKKSSGMEKEVKG